MGPLSQQQLVGLAGDRRPSSLTAGDTGRRGGDWPDTIGRVKGKPAGVTAGNSTVE